MTDGGPGVETPFAEIGVASCFSFLTGASQPEELVVTAHRLGLKGLGIADRNTLAGVVRAYQVAKEEGLPFAPGARLVFSDEVPDILAYPRNRAGWGRLCRLLSLGNLRGQKGTCLLYRADLLAWGEDINLAVLAPCEIGNGEGAQADDRLETLGRTLAALHAAFPGHVWLAARFCHDGLDQRRLARLDAIAAACRTPLLATNDVLAHAPRRRRLADVMTAIREHVPLEAAGRRLAMNAERHLKPGFEIARLFSAYPDALAQANRFFSQLAFDLKSLRYEYPDEALGLSCSPREELRRLAYEGAGWRYPNGVPETVGERIEHELAIIAALEYEPYFLTVRHIVGFARSRGILCQGRGSAANSVVCYCIGVTEVSPERAGLLFERFISPDRREPPDIDIDFEHERREEVIQYIFSHYGHDNAALAATVITYRARSALREVGKAFSLSQDAVAALAGSVWGYGSAEVGAREAKAAGLSMEDRTTAAVLHYAEEISGFPRHLSQHVGGFVITRGRIDETVPILRSSMDGRTIIEWDKDDIDELGILKIDILALGMLSCLRRAFDLLKIHYGREIGLADLSEGQDDPATYAMIQRADTLGVFQIESRAQMTMLPKLRPEKFYDLVIEVAIVRPGPIQGDMVHPYLRRKMGLEKVSYPKPELEAVLGRTLGVPLFQEQAMKIAIVAAGFTPGEADKLRRAMATFRRVGTIHTFRRKMIDGMVARGYEAAFAERCFKQIEGFGEYGFPESHAASFALLVYASCWLKCHYPDVFAASLLNAQPMGFYAPAQIVRDAREHGIAFRPISVNRSSWDQSLEPEAFDPSAISSAHVSMRPAIWSRHAVRLGFRQVKGLSQADMAILIARRGAGYDSVRDVWLRTGLKRAVIERLAEADAFACLGLSRRDALWAVRALDPKGAAERLPLFESAATKDLQAEPDAHLPPMRPGEEVVNDYRFLSLSLKAHPVSFVRGVLAARRVRDNQSLASLRSGTWVDVSGLVLVRQRPGSAKGVIFITIEDETGVANIIVWPKVFEEFRPLVLGARFIRVSGTMQSDRGVIHVVARTIEDLTPLLAPVAAGEEIGREGIARADHVRAPLRHSSNGRKNAMSEDEANAAAFAAGSLAAAICNADEVRRPVDEDARTRAFLKRHGRRAQSAAITPAEAADDGHDGQTGSAGAAGGDPIVAVLPRGRNFH
ncbi:error-prone DNA polymerase [Fulvimarina sp. 2208YS6-2-32]|uniref:Error-prone DNA polymerase n=1 Tax=Fulvimarina uroteuthidis TaxID=3098149 RepID=A0ABU5I134_9HYPH|nr:error-prone DNA polymerase [Fulvimarina sp. 2208YS6-2-32]MDY8109096.1 error-prone DNA polymerase [Fulvimarina sp. 2208YS6-2-32]